MAEKKSRAFDGFMMHPKQFFSCLEVATMSAAELGLFIRKLDQMLADGDVEGLRRYPFVGKLLSKRVGRPHVSRQLRRQVLERDSYTCQMCGATPFLLHIDHIIPVVFGGDNSFSNLQALCAPCNIKKGPRAHARRRGH